MDDLRKVAAIGELRGGDRSGLRQYNERLIMHVIRRGGGRPKADIARLTGLSPQTVSVIVNRMLAEGLLVKTEKLRGRVGQPSTLIRLNPEGAYAIGVKIGRRSLDILLMDLDGGISRRIRHAYAYPAPPAVFREIERGIAFVCEALTPAQRGRLLGVGVCAPTALDLWAEELGAPPEKMAAWREIDIPARISATTGGPVRLMNDVAAATAAELALGTAITAENCLYLYVGAFIGGGLVLSGQPATGARNNGCAIGSLPLSGTRDMFAGGKPEQLIRRASLIFLERALEQAGFDPDALADPAALPPVARAIYDHWRGEATTALAYAVASAVSVFDFEQVVIDGSLPRPEMQRIVDEVDRSLDRLNFSGLLRPRLALGSLGADVRALGAGLMPISASFEPDRDLLLKLATPAA